MNPLLLLSGSELARRIRTRQVGSEEVVAAHVEQLRRAQPRTHAVVRDRYDDALREAREADERLRREGPEGLPPLHGVPCTIKESFAVTGMPFTAGLVARARRGVVAQSDAPTVARLRAAGAIVLGVTNVSELCMWMESTNNVYGRSASAYDPGRTSGGSSGGEGAAVGSGGAPFGLGADIGGSIRIPAFFNGVFGHKPTGGLVPGSGQFPMAHGAAMRMHTTGPLARRSEDLFPLLRLLAGPDPGDPESRAFELGDPATVDVRGREVLLVTDPCVLPPAEPLRDAQARAARALERRGAKVRRASFPRLREGIQIWGASLAAAGGPTFAELMGEGTAIRPFRELGRWAIGRSPHTFGAIGLAILELAPKVMGDSTARFVEERRLLRAELDAALAGGAVMLWPPHARLVPRHHAAFFPPLHFGYTAVINALELPATMVPTGLDPPTGLPTGVQVIGAHGADHLTIAVARILEDELGGWVPPPAPADHSTGR